MKVPKADRQTSGEGARAGFVYGFAEDLGSEDVLALLGGEGRRAHADAPLRSPRAGGLHHHDGGPPKTVKGALVSLTAYHARGFRLPAPEHRTP